MKGLLHILLICFLMCNLSVFADPDSTTLNKEKWLELTKDLDYTEKQQTKEKKSLNIKPPNVPINSKALKTLAYVAVIIFILFILYKLNVFQLIYSYFKKYEKIHDKEEQATSEHLTPSKELLAEALKEKDRKLSLRLLYLAALHSLAENEFIRLRKEITNSFYIKALSGKSVRDDFRKIVRVHEMTWFGDKEITEQEYMNTLELTRKLLSITARP